MKATVNTTQGDRLRMRTGPDTSFDVMVSLPSGTVVTLLEGAPADGLTWWRVRTQVNGEGWVSRASTTTAR